MAFLEDLKAEIDADPLTRGYSGMSDAQVAVDLNTAYRSRNRTSLTGDALFTATDSTDFTGLTDHKRELWVSWTSKDSVDPWNASNVSFVTWIFGGGSTSLSNLAALRTESISRAAELGFPEVNASNVQGARALP